MQGPPGAEGGRAPGRGGAGPPPAARGAEESQLPGMLSRTRHSQTHSRAAAPRPRQLQGEGQRLGECCQASPARSLPGMRSCNRRARMERKTSLLKAREEAKVKGLPGGGLTLEAGGGLTLEAGSPERTGWKRRAPQEAKVEGRALRGLEPLPRCHQPGVSPCEDDGAGGLCLVLEKQTLTCSPPTRTHTHIHTHTHTCTRAHQLDDGKQVERWT